MRIYRTTWVDETWSRLRTSDPFHPASVALGRQGGGRFDNPSRYAALYASATPEGAVGEALAGSTRWLGSDIARSKQGRPRCLVTLELADESAILDLDDPRTLVDLSLKPSDVVRRNRDRTQETALRVWAEKSRPRVRGLRWWSYWRPEWTSLVLWSDSADAPSFPFVSVVDVEPVAMSHPAVLEAADVLPRELESDL